jgi:hypothetical protein
MRVRLGAWLWNGASMRTISVGLVVGVVGVVLGPSVAGCTSILGDFNNGSGDASTKDSGGPDGNPKADTGGHEASDLDHHVKGDTSTGDVSTSDASDAPADTGCAFTLCGTPAVCTDTTNDAKNCGKCGRSCLGGTCSSSTCSSVTMVDPAGSMATQINDADTDGTVVVWGDGGDSSVDQVSTPGGTKVVLVASGDADGVSYVAIGTGGALAYVLDNPGSWNTATLGTAASGSPQISFGAGVYPNGLVWDATAANVFMLRYLSATAGPYDLIECALGGGCTGIYTNSEASPILSRNVAYSSTALVFSDVIASTVYVYDPTSTALSATIPDQDDAYSVAADAKNVYWTTSVGTTNGLFSAAIGSTTVNTLIADTADGPVNGLATDGTNLYYVSAGGLYYVPVGGATTPTALDTTQVFFGVKYQSTNHALVYWTETGIFLIAAP